MAYQFSKISILIIEDNQIMLDLSRALLGTFGVGTVIGASNGELGYKKFCEHNPDIVIVDRMMKRMDGIAFTKQVRNDPLSPNPYVPIILMTGFTGKKRTAEALSAGISELLPKPFNAYDLYGCLVKVIEMPRPFVRTENYFGPERRGKNTKDFAGPPQRQSDDIVVDDEATRAIKARQQQELEALARLREHEIIRMARPKFNIRHEDVDWN